MDRIYVITALIYALLGMMLGIHMAASHNHVQLVTHAHMLLAGFVVSFIYGLCHRLWLGPARPVLAWIQFWTHQTGVLLLSLGLFLLYGAFVSPGTIEPLLSLASLLVLLAMALMLWLFLRTAKRS